MVTPCRPVTSSAAPGVDQAVRMGARYHTDNASVLTPIAIPSAVIQPAICPVVAPAATAACQMMAAELAKNSSKSINDVIGMKKINNTWKDVASSLGVSESTIRQDLAPAHHGMQKPAEENN